MRRLLPARAALPLRVRPVRARPDGHLRGGHVRHHHRHVRARRHHVGIRRQELLPRPQGDAWLLSQLVLQGRK